MGAGTKLDKQAVGNIGLFYACYQLARLGWNVMPTSRNARGIDILIYNRDALRRHTIQVKALFKAAAVPLGGTLDHIFADFVMICRGSTDGADPEYVVLTANEVRARATKNTNQSGQVSYWLEPREYASLTAHTMRDRIGEADPAVHRP